MDTPYDIRPDRPSRGPARKGAAMDYANLGEGDYGVSSSNRPSRSSQQQHGVIGADRQARGLNGTSTANPTTKEAQFKARARQYKEAFHALQQDCQRLNTQVTDYQARLKRSEESHRLEVTRLRKEADYHKRLRQGAEARTAELEAALAAQRRQVETFDDAQTSLIEQSQMLLAERSELKHKQQQMERELAQLQENSEHLTLQNQQLLLVIEKMQQEYDALVAGKAAFQAGNFADLNDDYDLDLYGDDISEPASSTFQQDGSVTPNLDGSSTPQQDGTRTPYSTSLGEPGSSTPQKTASEADLLAMPSSGAATPADHDKHAVQVPATPADHHKQALQVPAKAELQTDESADEVANASIGSTIL